MKIQDVLAIVAEEFKAVDQLIHQQLNSRVPLVEKIAEYIINSGGKRVRPLLVLLSSKALGQCDEKAIKLAAIIEFLHTATLLHDDVVDTSDLRRGKPTANAAFGNAPSVLVGDFLYSRAFQMMVELGSLEIMDVVSNATCVIAEGEVLQLTNVKNPGTTEQQYFDVIYGKTAMLFEASGHGAAILHQANDEQKQALRSFGKELGMAFQLIDDVLDYDGDAAELGKNVGDDLAEGKPTLPLIHALRHATEDEQKLIKKAIRQGGLEQMAPILDIVKRTGSIQYTRDQAHAAADRAIGELQHIPDSDAKQALIGLMNIAIERSS